MQKAGHTHLSAKTNTQLTKIAKLYKDEDRPVRAKQYIVADLVSKLYSKEFKK
jgi:hypothetical protein